MEASDIGQGFEILPCLYFTLKNFIILVFGLIPTYPLVLMTSGFNLNMMSNEGFYAVPPMMIFQTITSLPFHFLIYILIFDKETA